MGSTNNPVVLDCGSESIKAGYAAGVPSEAEPRLILPSIATVHPKPDDVNDPTQVAAALAQRGRRLPLVYRGSITNMTWLDSMLNHVLYGELGWKQGEEGAVLFVEPVFVGKRERETLAQLMFEGFNVAGLYLHDAASLSLCAAGKLSGCSVDIGHGKVDIATVSEGVTHMQSAVRMSVAGQDLTRLFGQVLAQQHPGLPQLLPHQLGALKAQCCRAAPSQEAYEQLLASALQQQSRPSQQQHSKQQQQQQQHNGRQGGVQGNGQQQQQQGERADEQELPPLGAPQQYTLPDGSTIPIASEGVQTAEALLRPASAAHAGGVLAPGPGLVDCIVECVSELSASEGGGAAARRAALDSVLLCGGGACMAGLGERVARELRAALPGGLQPRMATLPGYMAMPTPQYAPWVGGAVMAKLVAYQSHFMIKAEYEEVGPFAVHRKCA